MDGNMQRFRPELPVLVSLALVALMRLHVSFVRYFDSDEFAHLHWAWLIAHGKLPYRDFFYYITPFFQWSMVPFFWLPPDGAVLILIRIWQFAVLGASAFLLYRITRQVTRSHFTGLLSAAIFAAFPMNFDKTVDIRPDMLMMLLYLVAVFLILESGKNRRALVLSGISLSTGILLLPKIVFAVPAIFLLGIMSHPKGILKRLGYVLAGALVPVVIFAGYLSATNLTGAAFTAVLRDSVAVNAGKQAFSPWKALSPWPLVYVHAGGPSFPWYVNSGLWTLAAAGLFGLFRKHRRFANFLGLYYLGGVIFLFGFPAPYLQYFLPLSLFASMLAASAIADLLNLVRNRLSPALSLALLLTLLTVLTASFRIQYQERVASGNTNDEQMGVIEAVLSVSRPDETFYDMVGSYVFRPDGYIICCHPYAEFVHLLSTKPVSLRESLIASQTRFVILDRTGVSLWKPLPDDLRFLKTHYLPSRIWKLYTPGSWFACSAGTCHWYDMEKQLVSPVPATSFDIVIAESYTIAVSPPEADLTVNGRPVSAGPVRLEAGIYAFSADNSVQNFTVQMAR
ncbi:hypothetical protein A2Z33_03825 [Candidatus Gottesmanbacteria bacterium RBG_16_52_11]|uniref:Glycosyltransferase RgtA/B/C/D-like domain-containing protein n=1 Tax=Candidatus Gottesmanbacteria bacterium RBG_16_52_11 TaxID=1798374 RepID=A0A1F5YVN6_9BACT|nr:MAG: hypothetical protein A2Z33_03825 [Candidatus Gottesmanbacteria bacterium RBG_16_52_11]